MNLMVSKTWSKKGLEITTSEKHAEKRRVGRSREITSKNYKFMKSNYPK